MGHQDDILHIGHLGVREVAYIVADLSLLQGSSHIVIIYQGIPGEVKDHNPVLHHGQLFPVDHALGGIQQGHMDGYVITFLENGIHIGNMLYIPGQSPRGVHGNIGVISIDLHPQMGGCIGNLRTNGAQAHNAQLLALDLASGKSLFALLRILCNIVILGIGLAPLNAAHNIP